MIAVTIDGRKTEVEEGTTILRAARALDIHIPTLCYYEFLEPYAACRLCTVEIRRRGRTKMVTACNFPIEEPIEITTDSEKLRRERKVLLELLLARCAESPVLQKLRAELGLEEMRFGRGEDMCILCGLCVRVCDEIVGARALTFADRGIERVVTTPFGEPADACIACGACAAVCPTGVIRVEDATGRVVNHAEMVLGPPTPIHVPTMQAVPGVPVIDPASCIHFKTGACAICEKVCEAKAVNHAQEAATEEFDVGTIIVATGFQTVDPAALPHYGYGALDNVVTGLEVERMVNASGTTGGKVLKTDGTPPSSVGIIHCVGSRDKKTHEYCSRVCCMYSLKLAHLIHERSGAKVYNFYIDMRSFGKGYEEFYNRLLAEGVEFIRGRVAEVSDWAVTPMEKGKLVIRVEDTLAGLVRRIPVEMVVLSTGLEAREDAHAVRRLFNLSCSSEGFFLERHPKLAPVSTFTDGVFVAGCSQGPKDIPDAVAQAGAAAGAAMALIDKGQVELEPYTACIDDALCSGCQVCVPLCPYSAIAYDREKRVSVLNEALCKGCGTCVAACPPGAAQQHHFKNRQIAAEIRGVMAV